MKILGPVILLVLAAQGCSSTTATTAGSDSVLLADEILAFQEWDSKNAVPDRPVLFVGSSSIRFWSTADAFPGKPVINRGFGGSEMSDVIYYYDQVIKPYAADLVFLYEGDNDIARGKTVQNVISDFETLVSMVQQDFPDTMLYFISIKPSVSRWEYWPAMQEANRQIRKLTEVDPKLGYIDLATPLLGADGEPLDVFVDDDLHLNDSGYDIWNKAMAPYLN